MNGEKKKRKIALVIVSFMLAFSMCFCLISCDMGKAEEEEKKNVTIESFTQSMKEVDKGLELVKNGDKYTGIINESNDVANYEVTCDLEDNVTEIVIRCENVNLSDYVTAQSIIALANKPTDQWTWNDIRVAKCVGRLGQIIKIVGGEETLEDISTDEYASIIVTPGEKTAFGDWEIWTSVTDTFDLHAKLVK